MPLKIRLERNVSLHDDVIREYKEPKTLTRSGKNDLASTYRKAKTKAKNARRTMISISESLEGPGVSQRSSISIRG